MLIPHELLKIARGIQRTEPSLLTTASASRCSVRRVSALEIHNITRSVLQIWDKPKKKKKGLGMIHYPGISIQETQDAFKVVEAVDTS